MNETKLLNLRIGNVKSNVKGNVIVEFALVVSTIILISFGGIELARYLRLKQIVQTLSRESAMSAFRECFPKTGTDAQTCLQRVRTSMMNKTAGLLNSKELVISMYRFSGGAFTREAIVGEVIGTTVSKFSVSRLSTPGDETGIAVQNHELVVIAEIFGYSGKILSIDNSIGLSNTIYDAAAI